MGKKNIERDIEIFKEVVSGISTVTLAEKYGITDGRISQVFWAVVRLLRQRDLRQKVETLPTIFTKEKYPDCWLTLHDGTVRFAAYEATMKGWRAECDVVLKFLNDILADV